MSSNDRDRAKRIGALLAILVGIGSVPAWRAFRNQLVVFSPDGLPPEQRYSVRLPRMLTRYVQVSPEGVRVTEFTVLDANGRWYSVGSWPFPPSAIEARVDVEALLDLTVEASRVGPPRRQGGEVRCVVRAGLPGREYDFTMTKDGKRHEGTLLILASDEAVFAIDVSGPPPMDPALIEEVLASFTPG